MNDTPAAERPDRATVRLATLADVPTLVMLGKSFVEESGYPTFGVVANPYKTHTSFEHFIGDDRFVVYAVVVDGVIVGGAAAVNFSMYFSDSQVAIELFWWMHPDARNGAGLLLIQALEQWAKAQGCVAMCMVDLPGITSPASKIYERRGYELVERTWIRRIK